MCLMSYPIHMQSKATLKADRYGTLLCDINDCIKDKEEWKASIKLQSRKRNSMDVSV